MLGTTQFVSRPKKCWVRHNLSVAQRSAGYDTICQSPKEVLITTQIFNRPKKCWVRLKFSVAQILPWTRQIGNKVEGRAERSHPAEFPQD
ncbi:hypothetical protein RRG08_043341 [Elysia crispata]|uniref:Uncharacterized protein n=1 Tax=Elysia crispata TaxID=231223 RepID=A0AAE1BBD7_9GAST|nr:hypothetical protein RRG08_043341 [Elysia crispata]